MTDGLNAIVVRLERLERQRSWLIGMGAFCLVGIGSSLVLWYQARAPRVWQEIRAHKVVLVDQGNGQERGGLFLENQQPVLELSSSAGSRLVLGPDALTLHDLQGSSRAILGSDGLRLDDRAGKSRVVLGLDEGLEMYDPEGNRRVWLHLRQGKPALALSEKGNQIGLSLEVHGVYIWDHKGHFRASLACTEDDVGLLLADAEENTRIFLSNIHSSDETEIHILNKKEKGVWSAP
jgi:hypothetical protein